MESKNLAVQLNLNHHKNETEAIFLKV